MSKFHIDKLAETIAPFVTTVELDNTIPGGFRLEPKDARSSNL